MTKTPQHPTETATTPCCKVPTQVLTALATDCRPGTTLLAVSTLVTCPNCQKVWGVESITRPFPGTTDGSTYSVVSWYKLDQDTVHRMRAAKAADALKDWAVTQTLAGRCAACEAKTQGLDVDRFVHTSACTLPTPQKDNAR